MILLAVYSKSQWSLFSRLASELRKRNELIGIVYFGSPLAAHSKIIAEEACAMSCSFYSHEQYTEAIDKIPPPTTKWSGLDQIISPEHPYRLLVRRQRAAASKIVEESGARLLIVCEDGPGGDASLIMEAKRRALPVIVVPFGIGESKDYDVFIADKAAEGALNYVPNGDVGAAIREYASNWIRPTEYGEVLLFPAEFIIARITEGLDLPMPWAVQGGWADVIAVESHAMRRHFVSEGIHSSKLVDIGTIYCDTLFESLRANTAYLRAYEAQEKINAGRTSILVALPPSYHSTRGNKSNFETYENLCRSVFGYLKELNNVDVTVSVHPNSSRESIEAIKSTGARISEKWLVSLIPENDLLITDFSSTIRWAIAARKPVINFDDYCFNLTTYQGLPGVKTRHSFEDTKKEIDRLVNDGEIYHSTALAQRAVADEWGILDGRHFDRLYQLIVERRSNCGTSESGRRNGGWLPDIQRWIGK